MLDARTKNLRESRGGGEQVFVVNYKKAWHRSRAYFGMSEQWIKSASERTWKRRVFSLSQEGLNRSRRMCSSFWIQCVKASQVDDLNLWRTTKGRERERKGKREKKQAWIVTRDIRGNRSISISISIRFHIFRKSEMREIVALNIDILEPRVILNQIFRILIRLSYRRVWIVA